MLSSTIFWTLLTVAVSLVNATQTVYDIAAALESLAFKSYAVRPVVQTFTQHNAALTLIGEGPVVSSNSLIDEMITTIIANIAAMEFTGNFTDQNSEFALAQSYSDFVQGTLELCDAYTAAAATVKVTDSLTANKVYQNVQRLGNVVDAYFFNVIAIMPTNPDAVTQKNRVDQHFAQAWAAWTAIQKPMTTVPTVPQVSIGNATEITLNVTATTTKRSTIEEKEGRVALRFDA